MYDIIYNYLHENLFNSTSLMDYSYNIMGVDTSMDIWLSHTLTIVTIVVLFIVLCVFVRWLFKFFAGLLNLR